MACNIQNERTSFQREQYIRPPQAPQQRRWKWEVCQERTRTPATTSMPCARSAATTCLPVWPVEPATKTCKAVQHARTSRCRIVQGCGIRALNTSTCGLECEVAIQNSTGHARTGSVPSSELWPMLAGPQQAVQSPEASPPGACWTRAQLPQHSALVSHMPSRWPASVPARQR